VGSGGLDASSSFAAGGFTASSTLDQTAALEAALAAQARPRVPAEALRLAPPPTPPVLQQQLQQQQQQVGAGSSLEQLQQRLAALSEQSLLQESTLLDASHFDLGVQLGAAAPLGRASASLFPVTLDGAYAQAEHDYVTAGLTTAPLAPSGSGVSELGSGNGAMGEAMQRSRGQAMAELRRAHHLQQQADLSQSQLLHSPPPAARGESLHDLLKRHTQHPLSLNPFTSSQTAPALPPAISAAPAAVPGL